MNTAIVLKMPSRDNLVDRMSKARAIISAMSVAEESTESSIPPEHRETLYLMLADLLIRIYLTLGS